MTEVHCEMEYEGIHSDLCPEDCDFEKIDDELKAVYHQALDEWLEKSKGVGCFYISDEKSIVKPDAIDPMIDLLVKICKILYPNFEIEIYDEPWSSDEFIVFSQNGEYINRIHVYQLLDIIKYDLLESGCRNLRKALESSTTMETSSRGILGDQL